MGLFGWIILGVIVLALLALVGMYNRLVRLRALVKEGFSGITVQLRRRAGLIPNLVDAVKGDASYESGDFQEDAKARAAQGSGGSRAATPPPHAQPSAV